MTTVSHVKSAVNRYRFGIIINRFASIARDVLMAAAFGSQGTIAAFFVAYSFVRIPAAIISEGAMRIALLPHYERLKQQGIQRAVQLVRDLKYSFLLATTLLTLILSGSLFGIGIPLSPGNQQIAWLTAILAFSLPLIIQASIHQAILNSEHLYFFPSSAWALFNITWSIGILIVWNWPIWWAMVGLSCVFFIGYLIVQTFTGIPLHKRLQALSPFSRLRGLRLFPPDVRALLPAAGLAFLSYSAEQVNLAISPVFARIINPSGPAYLYYSYRLQVILFTIIGLSLVGGLLPSLTRVVANQNKHRYELLLTYSLRRTLELMIPSTVGLLLLGFPLVAFFYGRGKFTEVDALMTTYSLWAYAFMLVPRVFTLIQTAVFYAHHDYRDPAWIGLGSIFLNLLLNLAIVLPLQLSAPWIALMHAITVSIQALVLFKRMKQTKKHIKATPLWIAAVKSSLVAIVAAAISGTLYWLIFHFSLFKLWFGHMPSMVLSSFWLDLLHVALGGGVYVALLFFCRRFFIAPHLKEEPSHN